MNSKFLTVSFRVVIACAALVICAGAQQTQQQPTNPAQLRSLWIAKFSCDAKAASAVAATQHHDSDALQYSNLFSSVTTFETAATQPQGTWSLTANETDFSGGSTAARALIGYGAGRAHIEMEYKLIDPSGKVVWTAKIKTKPSWWGASGAMGAVQNQGAAEDEQAQKLTQALSKFFEVVPDKK